MIFCFCVLVFTMTYICATIGNLLVYIYYKAVDTIFGGVYLNMTIFGMLELIAGLLCLKFINYSSILT